jgi:hypothetical protein
LAEYIFERAPFVACHASSVPVARLIVLCGPRLPTLRFEKIHEETYRDFGFELVSVEPGNLVKRVNIIKAAIR